MTRKIIFLLSVLLVSLSAEAESRIDKLLRNLHDKNSQYVFVIAHRGDWRNAPENSIQCIENAIAMGADMVELDIQQTKDNNFICMHDATLDRTSTGKGAIKNYTTTELKQFVLKDVYKRQLSISREVMRKLPFSPLWDLTTNKVSSAPADSSKPTYGQNLLIS